MPAANDRTALYRLYDLDNHLLYVGISNKPLARWALHASDKAWWGDVAVRDIEWFPTRTEAEQAEVKAIAVEGPRWNASAGLVNKHYVMSSRRGWKPTGEFAKLLGRYKRAEATLSKLRGELELAIIEEMRAGASTGKISMHVPWSVNTLQQLGKRGGIPKLRKPTVVGLREVERRKAEVLAAGRATDSES